MIDRYTKTVLTVIAVALVVLAIQGAIGQSNAQNRGIQMVRICQSATDGVTCAAVDRTGGQSTIDDVYRGALFTRAFTP